MSHTWNGSPAGDGEEKNLAMVRPAAKSSATGVSFSGRAAPPGKLKIRMARIFSATAQGS